MEVFAWEFVMKMICLFGECNKLFYDVNRNKKCPRASLTLVDYRRQINFTTQIDSFKNFKSNITGWPTKQIRFEWNPDNEFYEKHSEEIERIATIFIELFLFNRYLNGLTARSSVRINKILIWTVETNHIDVYFECNTSLKGIAIEIHDNGYKVSTYAFVVYTIKNTRVWKCK